MRRRRRRRGTGLRLDRSGPWIAIVGLLMVLWCTVSTVLFAPWWGVAIAFALLVPQVWLLRRWVRTRPAQCVWIPVAGLAAWLALAFVGARVWGWTP